MYISVTTASEQYLFHLIAVGAPSQKDQNIDFRIQLSYTSIVYL